MTVIQLPEHEALALRARAATYGLTLKEWLSQLAQEHTGRECDIPMRSGNRQTHPGIPQRFKPDHGGWTIHDYIDRDRP